MIQEQKVRNSAEDALDEREYQLLVEGATLLDDEYRLETKFVTLVCGRLGLRAGELCHMEGNWINWNKEMIEIPEHVECSKGRGGDRCGYCHDQARQMADHHDDLTPNDALEYFWSPKTQKGARSVPFDFSPRIELVMERFFDRFDKFPYSVKTLYRRVKRAARNAVKIGPDDIYPHCLRATAASYHAGRGLNAIQLQALMGWELISTARHYVRVTGESTAQALREIHNR